MHELIKRGQLEPAKITPTGPWKLGVPTRADITDEIYLTALRYEQMESSLAFIWPPLSSVFINNHTVGALREGKDDIAKVHEIEPADKPTPLPQISTKAHGLLNPQMVLTNYLGRLEYVKNTIISAAPYLRDMDQPTRMTTNYSLESLPLKIRQRRTLDGWEYTFIPSDLLANRCQLIDSGLRKAYAENSDPLMKIRQLWEVINAQEKDPVNNFISMTLRVSYPYSTIGLEHKVGTEAYELSQLHKSIAENSQIYLDFDGHSIVVKFASVTGSYPVAVYQTNGRHLDQNSLFLRVRGDNWLDKIFASGQSVVNGIPVQVINGRFEAGQSPGPWFPDFIGRSIYVAGDSAPLDPSPWRLEEKYLIAKYRELSKKDALLVPFHPSVAQILSTYSGFNAKGGITTERYQTELLAYTLEKSVPGED